MTAKLRKLTLTLKIDPKTKKKYIKIGKRIYWIKNSVTKKKLAGFVNEKLKKLGYKTKKFRIGKPSAKLSALRASKRTFKQALVNQQAERKYVAPKAAKAAKAAQAAQVVPADPKVVANLELELENLQKRREPENIEFYQLTKDVLMQLAKDSNI